MDKKEKLRLELARDQADTWAQKYARVLAAREQARTAAAQAVSSLRGATFPVTVPAGSGGQNHNQAGQVGHAGLADDETEVTYRVLPLSSANLPALTALASYVQLPPFTEADQEKLHQLDTEIPKTIRDVAPIIEPKLANRIIKDSGDAQDAAEFLLDYVGWGLAEKITETLAAIKPNAPAEVNLANVLQPAVGLRGILSGYGTPELLPASAIVTPLATFSAAEKFPELAHAITTQHEYVVVCSPAGHTAADLITAISTS